MTGRWVMLGLLVVAAGVAGCGPAPMVEFTTPRIMMHVEADKLTSVEAIRGDVKVQMDDDHLARVTGTGVVRINEFHTVDVKNDGIRVHGVDIQSQGAMRDVFVEKDKVSGGVHPDKVKK